MKHSIRQRVLDPVTGLMVTKVETVNGELGSGIVDKNGKEIFEGDKVKLDGKTYKVICGFGNGLCLEDYKRRCKELQLHARLERNKGYGFDLEVIGHVGD